MDEGQSPARRRPAKKATRKAADPPAEPPAVEGETRTPRKRASTKRTTRKAAPAVAVPETTAAPAETTESAAPVAVEKEPVPVTEAPPVGVWDRIVADPGRAAEHLSEAAVRAYGPQAREWAEAMRARYPQAHGEGLARLAVARFRRLAAYGGAVSGALGPTGALVDVGALAWQQARLVLHVAAAYGLDPTAPERAAELRDLVKPQLAVIAVRQSVARAGALFRVAVGAAVDAYATTAVADRAVSRYRSAGRSSP